MSPVQVSCPACGGPVPFQAGTGVVAVCPYCRSVVARGDRGVEDLGKVAALIDTDSALEAGLRGSYGGVPFELVGRAQLGHPAGGVWDEWYAAFADGRWGWLAEAQGRFYLTFRHPAPPGSLPPFDRLRLGADVRVAPEAPPLTVAEKGEGRYVSAEGEIPYRLVPGSTYPYADLSGPRAEFATLDYGETPPLLFLGRELTLDELGIPPTARPGRREPRRVAGVQLACPKCGGPLELRAPDRAQRVTCPNCGSLLDVHEGNLRFLQALDPPGVKPVLPLGAKGRFGDREVVVVGFLRRSVKLEGVRYFWEEYLLYHRRDGFRWLVRSDDHWSFVEPLPPGTAHKSGRGADWAGQHFRIFQKAEARVEEVLGEFYWKVTVGERVQAEDYVRPPRILSREVTLSRDHPGEGEVNWSLGTYLPVAEVERAFGRKGLPRPAPFTVAPNQPFPHKRVYLYWLLLTAAALAVGLFVMAFSPRHQVLEQSFAVTGQGTPQPQVVFTPTFSLRAGQNIQIQARAEVNNAWVDVHGDLIGEPGGKVVRTFVLPVSYYHGVEDGEAWTEGSREASVFLSAQPAGSYRLRLAFRTEATGRPVTVRVRVRQGVPHFLPWVLTLLALALIPGAVGIYHLTFEYRRWKDSAFSPFHSG